MKIKDRLYLRGKCTQLGFTHFKTTATEGMKLLLEAFKEL